MKVHMILVNTAMKSIDGKRQAIMKLISATQPQLNKDIDTANEDKTVG